MIYDITQPLFECNVFPGDPQPQKKILMRIEDGEICNLSGFSACAHNGTHVDAPFHFISSGKTIDQVSLEKFIGPAYVVTHEGNVTRADAAAIVRKAASEHDSAWKKLLIKGKAVVTDEAAEYLAEAGIDLIGNESQTVGPEDAPMRAHLALLGAEVVLLEGIRLSAVPDGIYMLNCAPLNLSGCDGAPCRAILMDL